MALGHHLLSLQIIFGAPGGIPPKGGRKELVGGIGNTTSGDIHDP